MAAHMVQRLVAELLPARLARQQPASVAASEEVPELVTGVAAEEGGENHGIQLHVAAEGKEPGQHENGFALEESTEKKGEIAEVLQELLEHHRGSEAK